METMVHTTACVLARPTSSEPPFTLYPKNAGIVAIKNAKTAVLKSAYQIKCSGIYICIPVI